MPDATCCPLQTSRNQFHLDVDAQVVRQLGAELITDAEQALLELVKNSYDADSKWCNIIIESQSEHEILEPGTQNKIKLKGKISVQDAGSGMDKKALQDGWLTISLSPKRKMKAEGKVTPIFKRTPLGDKGLGRLGTMKLGDYLHISTHHDPSKKGHEVALIWSQCQSGTPLTQVPLEFGEIEKTGNKGTTIDILGLADPNYWQGEERINKLRLKLSTLISPFKEFSDFTIGLTVDEKLVDLVNFSKNILNTATAQFECTWDDSTLEMNGKVKLNIFKGMRQDDYEKYVLSDQGHAFADFLSTQNFASSITLKKSKLKAWYLEFQDKINWSEIPILQEDRLAIAKPGEFISELYAFNLNFSREESDNIFNELGDFAATLKELSGIYVFRNNFRVRASNDWLRLGEQWTSGGSYYGLKPRNTLGYFAISAHSNPKLLEKSDREGFIENAEYRGFYALATKLKSFANNSLEDLRRAYNDFLKVAKSKDAGLSNSLTAEDQAAHLGELAKTAKNIGINLKVSSKERTKALAEAKSQISTLLEQQTHGSNSRREFTKTIEAIEHLVDKIDSESKEVQTIVGQVAEKERLAEVITERFEELNTQITDTYETVGIGLAAQGLVHELHPLLEEINAHTRKIKNILDRQNSKPSTVYVDLEAIRALANLISRKMSFLDPMLRTFRETREDIDLKKFVEDFFELRCDRLTKLGIRSVVLSDNNRLILRINRGRLTQVLDNLTRNSEYWLKDYGLKSPESKLELQAKIQDSQLIFSDTGPGVRPALEKKLFDIFVTDKPKGQGHGLGLFIVSQILKAEGCSIHLGESRNQNNRRYQFIIDFSGVIK